MDIAFVNTIFFAICQAKKIQMRWKTTNTYLFITILMTNVTPQKHRTMLNL